MHSSSLKKKDIFIVFFLAIFTALSVYFLIPAYGRSWDEGFLSTELTVQETVEDNITRTEYVNEDINQFEQ